LSKATASPNGAAKTFLAELGGLRSAKTVRLENQTASEDILLFLISILTFERNAYRN